MWTTNALGAKPYRLAVAFSLAIITIVGLVFAIVYLRVSQEEFERVGRILEDEAARAATLDVSALEDAMRLRLTHDIRRLDYVALFDGHGAKLSGNLDFAPSITPDGGAHFVPRGLYVIGGDRVPALFVARRRADGDVVFLGRNLLEIDEIQNSLLRALVIALGPTLLAAFAVGEWFKRRAARRLNALQNAISRVTSGEFSFRLPVSKEGDDIDRVAADVNVMLAEIARLLDQLKSVGDNIAHDLRAPLSVVKAKLEGTLERGEFDAQTRENLVAALTQIDRAALTIEAILRISSVEVDAKGKRFAVLDLADIVDDIVDFYRPVADEKSIEMTCVTAATPLRGDAGLLGEAISNLVDNAIKYTPEGGKIRVEMLGENGATIVRINDTGPGIPSDEREKVFQRFFRGRNAAGIAGNGLGLDIARTIARLHGLDIVINSLACGGCLEIRVPAERTP